MKTLHLNLKRKWFDMIRNGEKPEEYREVTQYWMRRLLNIKIYDHSPIELIKGSFTFSIRQYLKHFDTVTFSNGYAKDRNQFMIKLKEIKISTGRPAWGAEPNKYYFVLRLGAI